MLYDTHIHTCHSSDSRMLLTDALQRASDIGIGVIVTEHADLNYPDPGSFRVDADAYFADYGSLRSDSLLLGVEIGLGPEVLAMNREFVSRYPFDYVLGSIHLVHSVDVYTEEYYRHKSKQDSYEEYLEAMCSCVNSAEFFDSLGHIDYICRYARYDDRELYYPQFQEQIDAVLRALVANGKVLEINTRRMDDAAVRQHLLPIYKRYSELGGQYVTLGSDAHKAEGIGQHFRDALAIAEACALQPVYFRERQLQLCTDAPQWSSARGGQA